MIKYTRKQINVKATLHDKEFVVVDDAMKALESVFNAAIDSGADKDKLVGILNEEDKNV